MAKPEDVFGRNLQRVLRRLQASGMRFLQDKREFRKPKVIYLRHRVDRHGLHTEEKKLQAIADVPKAGMRSGTQVIP